MAENDPQKYRMTLFQTQIVTQCKINDCYSFATSLIDRKSNESSTLPDDQLSFSSDSDI